MPVEISDQLRHIPPSTIGLPKNAKRPARPEDKIVHVKDPADGKVYPLAIHAARDKIRLDGWTMVVDNERPKADEPSATAEVPDAPAPVDIGEEPETEKEPTELDLLRDEYTKVSGGKEADKRWGKKVLQEKIAFFSDDTASAE